MSSIEPAALPIANMEKPLLKDKILPPCETLFSSTATALTVQPTELLRCRVVEHNRMYNSAETDALQKNQFDRLVSLERIFHVLANSSAADLEYFAPQMGVLRRNLMTSEEGRKYLEEIKRLYKDKMFLRVVFSNNQNLTWEGVDSKVGYESHKTLQAKFEPLIALVCAARGWKGYIELDLTLYDGNVEKILQEMPGIEQFGNVAELAAKITTGDTEALVKQLYGAAKQHGMSMWSIEPRGALGTFLDAMCTDVVRRDKKPPIVILDGLDGTSLKQWGAGPGLDLVESEMHGDLGVTLLMRTDSTDPRLNTDYGSMWTGRGGYQTTASLRLDPAADRLATQFGSPWPGRMITIGGIAHHLSEDAAFPKEYDQIRFSKVYNAIESAIRQDAPITAVIGPRECGKTTFLRVLSQSPVAAEVLSTYVDENGLWATFKGYPVKEVLAHLTEPPPYLIVDEAGFMDRSPDNKALLDSLQAQGTKLIYIYPSHAKPDPKIPAITIV